MATGATGLYHARKVVSSVAKTEVQHATHELEVWRMSISTFRCGEGKERRNALDRKSRCSGPARGAWRVFELDSGILSIDIFFPESEQLTG
jgi:hypothetical protein